jgi:parvulin-like peptidyl-prolyl isomerase
LENRNWKLENRKTKSEIRKTKGETRKARRVSNFEFRFSNSIVCEGILRSPLSILLPLVIFLTPLWSWAQSAGSVPQAASAEKTQSLSGERVVLTIGDERITATDIENFIQALPSQYQAFYGGQGKHLLPQYIIGMKVLSKEATKLNLGEQPEVTRALEIARESILTGAARQHFLKSVVVSDQELRELYQKDKTLSEEDRIRHILIRTEDAPLKSGGAGNPALPEPEARKKLQDIRERILAGADFPQMAKQYSEDTATAASGGDMGVIHSDKVVPPIVNAAQSLNPGQVSDLIPTPSGVEIIQVEDKHTKSFEEVKPALETQLRQSKATEIVQHLIDNYHVVIDQEYFAGTPAKQSSPASPTNP